MSINPQRTSNTTLQGSTLESTKGPLNTMFNLQGLRTVKARVNLPLYITSISGIFCVFNEYDNSPVKLYNGDIVLAVIASNGNPTYSSIADVPSSMQNSYILNSNRSYPINYQSGSYITFLVGEKPSYNYPNWTANLNNLYTLTNIFNLYSLMASGAYVSQPNVKCQAGFIGLSTNNAIGSFSNNNTTCYSGNSRWLYCNVANIRPYSNTPFYPGVNITLIILNPSVAQ